LGVKVVAAYTDNDISAFSAKRRPGFEDMLGAIENRRVDMVICWHTDRLYRSLPDMVRLLEAAKGLQIRTVQGGDIDLSTASGKMVATILGGESEHHSERRMRAFIQQAEKGTWQTTNRPFGYTIKGQPQEPEATALRDAVRDVLEGTSIQAIARRWNAARLTTTRGVAWRAPRVRRVLVNPRYAGLKVHRGKVVEREVDGKRERVKGDWTALIDEDTHDRLVGYLGDPARVSTTSWERRFPGAGIYRCGVCGGPMKSHQSGGPSQRRSYMCRLKGHVLRNAEHLDDHVANAILERLSRPDAALVIAQGGDDVGELQDARAGVVAKLDQLVELLDDGTLDGPKAREKAAQYKTRIAEIDGRLSAATRVSPAAAMLASGEDLRALWEQMDATLRSQVIDELVVVRVLPARRGRGFDPASVDIAWRRPENARPAAQTAPSRAGPLPAAIRGSAPGTACDRAPTRHNPRPRIAPGSSRTTRCCCGGHPPCCPCWNPSRDCRACCSSGDRPSGTPRAPEV